MKWLAMIFVALDVAGLLFMIYACVTAPEEDD